MYLGRNAKSRTPACMHKDWSLELFRIEWVAEESGYNPHLHCNTCSTTAKDALPQKLAVEFEGYDDKPEGWQVCDVCREWFDLEFSNSDHVCNSCDMR